MSSADFHAVFIHYQTMENRWPQLLDSCGVEHIDPAQRRLELEEIIALHSDHVPVWVVPVPHGEQIGAHRLEHFEHPPKALYIFGPDHGQHRAPEGSVALTIFTSRMRKALYADQAGAMVLWDRRMKLGRWSDVPAEVTFVEDAPGQT